MNLSKQTVVLVIPDLKGNGAEKITISLAKGFLGRGYEVLVVCFGKKMEFDTADLNIKIFPINLFRWIPRNIRGPIVAPLLDRFIRRHSNVEPSLVISSLLPCDRILSFSKIKNVHLLLQSTMSKDMATPQKIKERDIYKNKPVICCSNGVLKDFQKIFPDRKTNSIRIYNPIDTNEIEILSREISTFKCEDEYIIHIGKFKSEKRHDILLKAFALAKTTKKLVLVGQGPMEGQIRSLCQNLGIEDKIIFAGFHSNPFPILKQAKLLVLTSDFEGLPTVLLEAAALGIPAISTDCDSGPREILAQHQLAPTGDIQNLAKMLDQESYSIFKKPLDEVFTLDYCLDQYIKLCR